MPLEQYDFYFAIFASWRELFFLMDANHSFVLTVLSS